MRRNRIIRRPSFMGSRHRRSLLVVAVAVLAIITTPLLPGAKWAKTEPAAASAQKQRIVALTPFSANALALMGVFPKAIGQTLGGERRYASGLRLIPRLALNHDQGGPNLERMSDLSPKIVFTGPRWAKSTPGIKSLRSKPRVVNADPRSIRAAFASVRRIARLVKRKARGKRLAIRMKRGIRRSTRGIKKRPDVMVLLALNQTQFSQFMPGSWGAEVVERAGGRLFYRPDEKCGKKDICGVTLESLLGLQLDLGEEPDVIIAVPHGKPGDVSMEFKSRVRKELESLDAVKNDRLEFSVDNRLLQAGTDIGATIRQVRKFIGS